MTWETLLRHAPVPRVAGWGPSVIFSMLKAGAHIGAHTGMYNTRLICHLPLIVPPGCRFRVGNEVREWEEGKLLIFDDTIEHEAWNEGPRGSRGADLRHLAARAERAGETRAQSLFSD